MKNLYFILFIISSTIYSQENSEMKIYLESGLDFKTSSQDNRSDAQAGVGMLGLKFEKDYIYGKLLFTVFSMNEEIISESDNKIFGTNLLVPSNSSNSISNFTFQLGTKSFYNYADNNTSEPIWSIKRFGAVSNFSIFNNHWSYNDTTLPVTITVFDLHMTYRLLSEKILGENNGRVDFYIFGGFSSRRLGGDYGLKKNSELRKEFIGTVKRGFNGTNLGARLEISNFYGQVNLTNFGRDEIDGFSGSQAVISVGFNANLNLVAKSDFKSSKKNESTTSND